MKYYVCAIIKNEHKFLEEWIKHNLSIGFTDIILVEDIGSDSHKVITDKFSQVKLIGVDEFMSKSTNRFRRQLDVFKKFIELNKDGWCAFIDPDEYIDFGKRNIYEVTQEFEDYQGVALPWIVYGADEHIKSVPIRSYKIECDYLPGLDGVKFKSFVNLSKATGFFGIHCSKGLVDINKNKVFTNPDIVNNIPRDICIHHYYTKSFEDFVQKNKKKNFNQKLSSFDSFFKVNTDMLFAKDLLMNAVNSGNPIDFDKLEAEYNELKSKLII